jgi:hypothetical protein
MYVIRFQVQNKVVAVANAGLFSTLLSTYAVKRRLVDKTVWSADNCTSQSLGTDDALVEFELIPFGRGVLATFVPPRPS